MFLNLINQTFLNMTWLERGGELYVIWYLFVHFNLSPKIFFIIPRHAINVYKEACICVIYWYKINLKRRLQGHLSHFSSFLIWIYYKLILLDNYKYKQHPFRNSNINHQKWNMINTWLFFFVKTHLFYLFLDPSLKYKDYLHQCSMSLQSTYRDSCINLLLFLMCQ